MEARCTICRETLLSKTRIGRELCRRCEVVVGPRRVGGRYYNGYWNREYTVEFISVDSDGRPWLTVRWTPDPGGRDGHITQHCTAWNPKRDRVIEEVP